MGGIGFLELIIVGAIALPIVLGIGFLVVYLVKQGQGAKDSMKEGKRRQAEMEQDVDAPPDD